MQLSSLLSSGWAFILAALPRSLDLTALARSQGAIKRSRRISDGETLLRLALWYGPCGLSLRSAAALAAGTETAYLSDVALLKRLAGSADWLEAIVAAVLAERATVSAPLADLLAETRVLVLLDGTTISQRGRCGTSRYQARQAQGAKEWPHGDPRSEEAARYMIIATSLSPESHTAASILALYKMRT